MYVSEHESLCLLKKIWQTKTVQEETSWFATSWVCPALFQKGASIESTAGWYCKSCFGKADVKTVWCMVTNIELSYGSSRNLSFFRGCLHGHCWKGVPPNSRLQRSNDQPFAGHARFCWHPSWKPSRVHPNQAVIDHGWWSYLYTLGWSLKMNAQELVGVDHSRTCLINSGTFRYYWRVNVPHQSSTFDGCSW